MKSCELFGCLDGLAEALESLLGGDPLACQALGLASLLEQRATFREVRVGCGATLPRPGQRVPIALQLGQGELALLNCGLLLADAILGDLEPAGVLGALGAQIEDRPFELPLGKRGPAVRPADRGLEAITKGGL